MILLLDESAINPAPRIVRAPVSPTPARDSSFVSHVASMENVRVALQRVVEQEPMADPRAVAEAVLSALGPDERDAVAIEFLAARVRDGA